MEPLGKSLRRHRRHGHPQAQCFQLATGRSRPPIRRGKLGSSQTPFRRFPKTGYPKIGYPKMGVWYEPTCRLCRGLPKYPILQSHIPSIRYVRSLLHASSLPLSSGFTFDKNSGPSGYGVAGPDDKDRVSAYSRLFKTLPAPVVSMRRGPHRSVPIAS